MTDSIQQDSSIEISQRKSARFLPPLLLVVAVVVFSPFRGWLFAHRSFNIPSGSMNPTLQKGDVFWVSTLSYGISKETYPFDFGLGNIRFFASTPRRGDVAVLRLPSDNKTTYIERVIGLPGDKIQMKQGRFFINGIMVAGQRVADLRARDLYGKERPLPAYEETMPEGLTYTVLEVEGDKGFYDNTSVYNVPPGHYFVMGDNRDNSADSRIETTQNGVGMVPYENFIGRIDRVYFSTERLDRFFQPIR